MVHGTDGASLVKHISSIPGSSCVAYRMARASKNPSERKNEIITAVPEYVYKEQ